MKYIILILYNIILIYHHQDELINIILFLSAFLIGLTILASEPVLQYEKYPPNKNKFKIFLYTLTILHTSIYLMSILKYKIISYII